VDAWPVKRTRGELKLGGEGIKTKSPTEKSNKNRDVSRITSPGADRGEREGKLRGKKRGPLTTNVPLKKQQTVYDGQKKQIPKL